MRLSRRQFLVAATLAGGSAAAGALLPPSSVSAAGAAVTPLDGASYSAKFSRQLPRARRVDLTGSVRTATVTMRSVAQQVLTGYPKTACYTYDGRWPGPTIIARRDRPVHVTWRNQLPSGPLALADGGHLLPVDPSLLEADTAALPAGQIPTVPHLHGGHTEWQSDGHPEAWFTQRGFTGSKWVKDVYTFANDQRATDLWYHDHTMGMTRLNIYAGLAGHYLVRDEVEDSLIERGVLPQPAYEHELMIQDRSFTSDGQLYLPLGPNGQDPLDFYGDFMCVNGVPWPVLDVEPRKYRFRIANGGDSRFLVLKMSHGAGLLVVGSDQGLLPAAAMTPQLLVAPGERYDVVIDFTGLKHGDALTMQNIGVDNVLLGFQDSAGALTNRATDKPITFGPPPAPGTPPGPPAPDATPADPRSSGLVMKFRVAHSRSHVANASVRAGTVLAGPYPRLRATKTRGVMTAFVGGGPGGAGGMELLGSLETGTANWMDPVTERVKLGATEVWEVFNTGPVAHPIHLHLVDFEVLDRAPFTFTSEATTMPDGMAGAKITVTGTGPRRAPEAWETGRKDTVVCYPGEVTRMVATFDRSGNYVWHCHLLHHEDHGMMRPLVVT